MNTGKLLDQARKLNKQLTDAWHAEYYRQSPWQAAVNGANRMARLNNALKHAKQRESRRFLLKQNAI
jgi:hypothetical protein